MAKQQLRTRILSIPTPCIHPIALRPLAALVPKSAIHLPLHSPTSTSSSHRHFSRHAPSSNFALWPRKEPAKYFTGEKPHIFKVQELKEMLEFPEEERMIIDVREPHELADTGRIPGAVSMPLNSNPNAIFLAPELFYRTFGFIKPGTSRAEAMIPETGEGEAKKADSAAAAAVGSREGVDKDDGKAEVRVNEVIFYCKTGVRSKMAAHMAMNEIGWVPGVQSADLKGGWVEWLARGGKVEKVGE